MTTYEDAIQDKNLYALWLIQVEQLDAEDLAGRVAQIMSDVGLPPLPAFVIGLTLMTLLALADFVAENSTFHDDDEAWGRYCAETYPAEPSPALTDAERNPHINDEVRTWT